MTKAATENDKPIIQLSSFIVLRTFTHAFIVIKGCTVPSSGCKMPMTVNRTPTPVFLSKLLQVFASLYLPIICPLLAL